MEQQKVLDFLEQNGITQAMLSRSISMSSSAISQYLKGDVMKKT